MQYIYQVLQVIRNDNDVPKLIRLFIILPVSNLTLFSLLVEILALTGIDYF